MQLLDTGVPRMHTVTVAWLPVKRRLCPALTVCQASHSRTPRFDLISMTLKTLLSLLSMPLEINRCISPAI